MLRFGLIAVAFTVTMALGGCKSDAEKACFDKPPKDPAHWVSACGEACDHAKNKKACAKTVEIANDHCIKRGNRKVCSWMCNYASTGKEVYCKHLKGLDAPKKK